MFSFGPSFWAGKPAPAFSPLTLSPALWLDASDATTLYQSNGGILASADGDPVGYWLDKSGNSRHATQVNGTLKPLLKTAILNGKNGILGDGVDDYLQSAADMNGWAGTTWFFVGKPVGSSSVQVANYSTGGGLFSAISPTAVDFDGRAHGGNYTAATSSYSSSNAARILTGAYDGTYLSVKNNNLTKVTVAASTGGTIISRPQLDIFGNTSDGVSVRGNGYLFELLVFNFFCTSPQVDSMLSYLNAKWGVY